MGDPAFFKNQEQLLSHGDIPLRRDALAIIEAGIASVIPYQATKELIRLEGADIFVRPLHQGPEYLRCGGGQRGLSHCPGAG